MAKKSGGSQNILRISGMFFAVIGIYHLLRSQGISLRFIELTRSGSLIYGLAVLLLSVACFLNSQK